MGKIVDPRSAKRNAWLLLAESRREAKLHLARIFPSQMRDESRDEAEQALVRKWVVNPLQCHEATLLNLSTSRSRRRTAHTSETSPYD